MIASDRARFAAVLAVLAEAYREPCSQTRLEAYWMALEDLPVAAVESACGAALRESKFFPRPSELRQWAVGPDPDVGVVDSLVHDWLWGRAVPAPDFARLAVDRIGGRRAVEDMPAGVRFAHLRDALPGLLSAARRRRIPVPAIDYVPQVRRPARVAPVPKPDVGRLEGRVAALVGPIGRAVPISATRTE